eukprot:369881_1
MATDCKLFEPNTDEFTSFLKINNQGWNSKIFVNQNNILSFLCTNCQSICCDAVELGCDHNDSDIFLYCSTCLKLLINKNRNKCPINSHENPIITIPRSTRRQISNSIVICPNSTIFLQKHHHKNDNLQVIDTSNNHNEKEGCSINIDDNTSKGCDWKGTLHELLTGKHLAQCMEQYPTENVKIKQLQNEIIKLHKIIDEKDQKIKQQSATIEAIIDALNDENKKLRQKLKTQSNIIAKQKNEINLQKQNVIDSKDYIVVESDNKCKKSVRNSNDNSKNLTFHTNDSNDNKVYISNNGKTLNWKGSFWCGPCNFLFGNYLKNNEQITVYFKIQTVGDAWNYKFGFVSNKCFGWTDNNFNHQIFINGNGTLCVFDEFIEINNNIKHKNMHQFAHLFNVSLNVNIIAISINMQTQIGRIWNNNAKKNVLKVNIPKNVGVIIGLQGTSKKYVKVVKIVMKDAKKNESDAIDTINDMKDVEEKIDRIKDSIQKSCEIYWNEIKLLSMNKKHNKKQSEKHEEEEYPLMEEMDAMSKVLFGRNNNRKRTGTSEYFDDNDFECMNWPIYFEIVINKENDWKYIYKICHECFKNKVEKNDYHSNDVLSNNEILNFLWIYVGYVYWNAKNVEFTLGDFNIMFEFLCKLNHLFKAIMIAYDYEMYQWGNILNHFMKTYLKNINSKLLIRANQIWKRKIVPNKQSSIYRPLKKEYELLQSRTNLCKMSLQENGIHLMKM